MATATVQSASSDDVADIRAVARRSWAVAYDSFAERTIERALATSYGETDLRQAIGRPEVTYLVAREREGKRVVGYASGVHTGERTGRLPSLCVDPDRWGEGIGTALAERVISALQYRGVRRLELEVLADNEPGIEFCERRGFERVGERETEFGGRSCRGYVYASDFDQ